MAAGARMIFKMHRELILWGSLGNVGLVNINANNEKIFVYVTLSNLSINAMAI